MSLPSPPFNVSFELEGWVLYWVHLEPRQGGAGLSELRASVAAEVRSKFEGRALTSDPAVAALRKLFRAAGCDPTRYRPSSEALLRRLIKGSEIPEIHPLVDLSNCLSARLHVPCCVMDEVAVVPPYLFRSGRAGEAYESLRGPFNLEGKPLLLDQEGPCDAPVTGSRRVCVGTGTQRVWLVAYLPADAVSIETATQEMMALIGQAPVARIRVEAMSEGVT